MELGALLQVGSHLYHIEMAVGLLNYARDLLHVEQENQLVSYPILYPWRDIQSRRPRNRNQYLYVTSIGPGCCTTVTQGGEWLSAL